MLCLVRMILIPGPVGCQLLYGRTNTDRELLRTVQLSYEIVNAKLPEKKHWKDICREHLNYDPDICPHCGKGKMVTMERFFPERSPPLVKPVLNGILMK